MVIRKAVLGDEQAFWTLQKALDGETKTMRYEPDERTESLKEAASAIERAVSGEDLLLFAQDGDALVGYLRAQRGAQRRTRHTACLDFGMRPSHSNRGIARMFFRLLDDWAQEEGLKRLELTVLKDNLVARHVCQRHGFQYEGERQCAVNVDGRLKSELYMAKLFD